MGTAMTVTATRTSPNIACPPWCTVPQEEHVADLPDWEGFVIHWSEETAGVRLAASTYIDGTPDPEDPPLVYVHTSAEGITPDDAERLAGALLAVVREARA
jgi:hypothetical protein